MKDFSKLMEVISEKYNKLLGKNLVGIYVHGSIAFGCFNWDKSDIDFIVVINEPVPQQTCASVNRPRGASSAQRV